MAGRSGTRQEGTPTNPSAQMNAYSFASRQPNTTVLKYSCGSTNKGFFMQNAGGTKPTVDNQVICGTIAALCFSLLTNEPMLLFCKPFSLKACLGDEDFHNGKTISRRQNRYARNKRNCSNMFEKKTLHWQSNAKIGSQETKWISMSCQRTQKRCDK